MKGSWTQRQVDGPQDDLLTAEEVASLFGISTDTLTRWIDAGEFPEGLPLGKQAKVWDWQSVVYYRLRMAMKPRLSEEKPTATGGKPTATKGKPSASETNP